MAKYQKVYLRVVGMVGDKPDDEDKIPNRVMATGTWFMKPNLRDGTAENAIGPDGIAELELPTPVDGEIVDGWLTYNGDPYVWLRVSEEGWNWQISFPQLRIDGKPKKLDLWNFDVPAATPQEIENGHLDPEDPNYYRGINLAPLVEFVNPSTGQKAVKGDTGYSIVHVELIGTDSFRFVTNNPDPTQNILSTIKVPILELTDDILDAAAATVAAAEMANTDAAAALGYKNVATDAAAASVLAAENADGFRQVSMDSAAAAVTAAEEADSSETAAKASETAAKASETAAKASETNALSYRNTASGHATNAGNAKTAAESARDGAVTARQGAETARAGAELARDQAVNGVVPENGVSTSKIQDKAVTKAKTSDSVQGSLDKADSSYQKPGAGIPKGDLQQSVQDSLSKADAALPKASFPGDFVIVSHTGTRKVGGGDIGPQYIGKALRVDSVVYQFDSPDASGDTVVRLMNGNTEVAGSRLTVSASNQVDGIPTDNARTATLTDATRTYAKGGRLRLDIVSVGTTPGKGLRAWINCVWTQL